MAFKLAEAFVQLSTKGFGGVMGAIGGVKTALGGIAAAPLTAAFTALAGGASVAGLALLASGAEQTSTQFKTLLGNADSAKKMVADLQQFGASTPFEFAGLANTAKTLLSFQVSQEQILPTMRMVGDIASATGNSIEELAGIYGKAKSRGALMTEQLDQFNERGIPVGAKLAEMLGKTSEEIRDMAGKGQISFGDLQRAMQSMTSEGGMAFNGMADQSQTLGGLFSTLKDSVTVFLTDIGTAMVDGFDLKTITQDLTTFVDMVKADWMPSIVAGFMWMKENITTPFLNAIRWMGEGVYDFVLNADLYWQHMYLSLGNSISNMWNTVSTFFQNGVTLVSWFGTNFVQLFTNAIDNSKQLFWNYIEQIKNNWNSLLNFFTTGVLQFDWSPMKDSFNRVVGEIKLPKLAVAQQDLLKSDITAIEKQLSNRMDKRQKEQIEAANKSKETKVAELKIDEATTEEEKTQTKEKEKQKGGFSDLASLADKMQESVFGIGKNKEKDGLPGTPKSGLDIAQNNVGKVNYGITNNSSQTEKIDSLARQVSILESILALAQGSGIKVSMPGNGAVQLPSASVRFGATGS
jgi:tape measure domain-containing protein